MDTPVETDHALLRNRRWDVARAAYHRSRPLAVRWFSTWWFQSRQS